jgi:hypothetical protein
VRFEWLHAAAVDGDAQALASSAAGETLRAVVREELAQLMSWEERHRRLVARLTTVVITTALVDVVGSILIYHFERHAHGTQIRVLGDAFFFTTVQLLTVSSQIQNPFTAGGRVVDVFLEMWGVIVVAGTAGAIAAFFQKAD